MPETKEKRALKPAKELNEQVDILVNRGLHIDSEEAAISALSSINYYRLRGYYIHLQKKGGEEFLPGTSLAQLLSLHSFDSELRLLLLQLLFDIEIVARTRIAYVLGNAWGPAGYLDETNYQGCNHESFEKLIESVNNDIARSRELFVKTHNEKYDGIFPIWVAVEVMSFGDLSKLYSLLPPSQRANIANCYEYLDETALKNWLHISSVLRNTCAHNSRIYGKSLAPHALIETKVATYMSAILGPSFNVYPNTLFAYLLGIRRISRSETWNAFLGKLKKLISDYQGIIEPIKLGFPYQWALILLPK